MKKACHMAVWAAVARMLPFCLFLAACAREPAAPELLPPEDVAMDTAAAVVGTLTQDEQFRASVKARARGYYFREASLPLKSVNFRPGEEAKDGDVLVELDDSGILEEIAVQESVIEHLARSQRHEVSQLVMDILMAEADPEAAESLYGLRLRLRQAQEIQSAELDWEEQKLQSLKKKLEDTKIIAESDGVVVYATHAPAGSKVAPFKPLIYLEDMADLYVQCEGPATASPGNAPVRAVIGGKGYGLAYSPLPQDELLSYILDGRSPPSRFEFTGTNEGLSPGQSALVIVTHWQKPNVLLVPINAVYKGSEASHYVYVVENGEKVFRSVKAGSSNGCFYEIMSGLGEGEEVFVKQ